MDDLIVRLCATLSSVKKVMAAALFIASVALLAQENLPPLPQGARALPSALPKAQTAPRRPVPERPGSFREEARVDRVVIDAHVTDDDGEPIRDLTAADFVVKVDGKRVALESIEWISAGNTEEAYEKNRRGALAPR